MSSILTRVLLSILSVAFPAVMIVVAAGYALSTEPAGMIPFVGVIIIALLGVSALSWLDIRYGQLPQGMPTMLTCIPFILMVAFAIPSTIAGHVAPLLLWGIPCVLAILVSSKTIKMARKIAEPAPPEGRGEAPRP